MLNVVNPIGTPRTARSLQKVVVVNGHGGMLELLESVLDAGRYDIVLVSETDHAYSQIKRNRPNLVVLCLDLDDPVSFHVLSMLKLDEDTADIPVLTYANPTDVENADSDPADEIEAASLPLERPEHPMN